jgi:5-methylcytosine-specific restriction endonuclease McrA
MTPKERMAIIQALRKTWRCTQAYRDALEHAKTEAYTETPSGGAKRRVAFVCAQCATPTERDFVQVDHKVPVGAFRDWDTFVDRLFCPAMDLQILCEACHSDKTHAEAMERRAKAKRA